jgi:hypothetical protein
MVVLFSQASYFRERCLRDRKLAIEFAHLASPPAYTCSVIRIIAPTSVNALHPQCGVQEDRRALIDASATVRVPL